MIIFQYLDALPKIPLHLLVDALIPDESQIGFRKASYKRWAAKPELLEWLNIHISSYVNIAGIQTQEGNLQPHCDKRRWAVNYLIKTGGTNATTEFYQRPNHPVIFSGSGYELSPEDELKVIKQVVIEPGRWHIINTHILHGVTNVESQRRAVTIGLNSIDPFSELKCENI